MFNIYFREGELMEEDAKIRFLSKKIKNQGLQQLLKHSRFISLQVGQDLSPILQQLTTLAQ
eukprot:9285234-Ditylum_brightwellii.AAC.1